MELRGEVALVTGAAVGIGRAIAVRIAVDGQAVFIRADMRVPADVENLVATVVNEFAGGPRHAGQQRRRRAPRAELPRR